MLRFIQTPTRSIWKNGSDRKRMAPMASKILNNERKPVPLATFAQDVARRKAVAGITDLPQNSGKRRTESKKALLKAVDAAGKSWSAK